METNKHRDTHNSLDLGLADKCIFCVWVLLAIGLIIQGC